MPLSQLFQKSSDTWECPTCMIANKNSAMTCAACTSLKPTTECDVTVSILSLLHAFSFTAPSLWNELPFAVHESNTLDIFKQCLKTLFNVSAQLTNVILSCAHQLTSQPCVHHKFYYCILLYCYWLYLFAYVMCICASDVSEEYETLFSA